MLEVSNLSIDFHLFTLDNERVPGFSNVSFRVTEGDSFALVGPSGSGKSSILKSIYRTYIPQSGSILYESQRGEVIDLLQADDHTIIALRKEEIGFITQFLYAVPRVSAVDVVAEPLLLKGEYEECARQKAQTLLLQLGISEKLLQTFPATFSGGEKQRVNIARGILSAPRLLLMDEPTASLDDKTKGIVLPYLKELPAKGTTIIGIFHDLDVRTELTTNAYVVSKPEEKVCI